MKIVTLILTYLFAAVFLILGVGNYFFHFMPAPKPPTEVAAQFGGILFSSQYMLVIKIFELAGALMIASISEGHWDGPLCCRLQLISYCLKCFWQSNRE